MQTKVLTGVDANGSATDGQIAGTSRTRGPTAPGSQQPVRLHGDGDTRAPPTFGFLTGIADPSTVSSDRNYTAYDSFITNSTGTKVIGDNYVWNTSYTGNLTGSNGGLYFSGPNAVCRLRRTGADLYAQHVVIREFGRISAIRIPTPAIR